jgi:hypothetical protein
LVRLISETLTPLLMLDQDDTHRQHLEAHNGDRGSIEQSRQSLGRALDSSFASCHALSGWSERMRWEAAIRAHGPPIDELEARKLAIVVDPIRIVRKLAVQLQSLCLHEIPNMHTAWRQHPELCYRSNLPPGTPLRLRGQIVGYSTLLRR